MSNMTASECMAEIVDFFKQAVQPCFFDLDDEGQREMMQALASLRPTGFEVVSAEQSVDLAYGLDGAARWCMDSANDCERDGMDPSYDLMLEAAFRSHAQQVRKIAARLTH